MTLGYYGGRQLVRKKQKKKFKKMHFFTEKNLQKRNFALPLQRKTDKGMQF